MSTAEIVIAPVAGGEDCAYLKRTLQQMYCSYSHLNGLGFEVTASGCRLEGELPKGFVASEGRCHALTFVPKGKGKRHTAIVSVAVNGATSEGQRLYVTTPYQRVKDLKNGVETEDVDAVFMGLIDIFVEAYQP